MARIEIDPNYSSPTFSRATAATDPFKKEDVQALAAALSTHTHGTGKGLAIDPAGIPAGAIPGSAIADGGITSAKIADGTIATGDLANSSVTNIKLGTDTARANLLTNGGFEIWQRGNGPFTVNGFTADKWSRFVGGTDTFSISKDTANCDIGSQADAVVTFTLGTGAGASTLWQYVKTTECALNGKVISANVRVRTSTASAVQLVVKVNGGSTIAGSSTFHTGDGTYQTLTVSNIAVPSNETQLNIEVHFAASCTAYLDNAMLVVGSVAADYAPLHPADDLARCLRYYEVLGDAANDMCVNSYHGAGAVFQIPVRFKANKAVTPTMTKNGTWSVTNCAQPGAGSPGLGGFVLFSTVTATAGFTFINDAVGKNIVAEANP